MSKFITPIRIWIAVATGLGAIAIAMLGVVEASELSCNAGTVLEKYRHFFRSAAEQADFENQIPTELLNHACCTSSPYFIQPTSALTNSNENVIVLQNVSNNFQNFPVETCRQTPDCTCSCNCKLRKVYFSAIVQYPPPINTCKVSQIKLLADCKCM